MWASINMYPIVGFVVRTYCLGEFRLIIPPAIPYPGHGRPKCVNTYQICIIISGHLPVKHELSAKKN